MPRPPAHRQTTAKATQSNTALAEGVADQALEAMATPAAEAHDLDEAEGEPLAEASAVEAHTAERKTRLLTGVVVASLEAGT